MSNPVVKCSQCHHYTPSSMSENGDCKIWDLQIRRGVSVQQNALFYRTELGGDNLYSNCEFIADELRDCKQFIGVYRLVVGY